MFREPCSPLHQGEEEPDTELFLRAVLLYITLLVGVVGGKKRIVGEKGEGGGENWSVFNNRKNGFFPYFIYVVAIISIEIVRVFLYLYGFSIVS